MIEILSARDYYGRHATGTVVLVNGQPSHYTGPTALRDARAFAKKLKENIHDQRHQPTTDKI